ncbi:Ectoine dioxygenase [Diplonema papillatum]|nr:Ectoine dioxygenase [Diplonema papillatum]
MEKPKGRKMREVCLVLMLLTTVLLFFWQSTAGDRSQFMEKAEPLAIRGGGEHTTPQRATLAQLRDWNREGFLVVRSALTPENVAELRRYLDEMQNMPAVKGGIWKYFEDDRNNPGTRILNRIEKFTDYHKGMREFIQRPFVRGMAADLVGGDVVLFKEKVNFKLPGGGGFAAHQDMQPGWDKYAPRMLSVLLCADANTLENGALEVAPGAHARPGGLIGRMHAPLNETETLGLKWVPVVTEPGDVVFFDAWTPHRSAANPTPTARRNTFVTFNEKKYGDHRNAYYADKYASLPPDADRDPSKDYKYVV